MLENQVTVKGLGSIELSARVVTESRFSLRLTPEKPGTRDELRKFAIDVLGTFDRIKKPEIIKGSSLRIDEKDRQFLGCTLDLTKCKSRNTPGALDHTIEPVFIAFKNASELLFQDEPTALEAISPGGINKPRTLRRGPQRKQKQHQQ